MCDIKKESLLNKNKGIERTVSNAYDELRSFRTWLKWMCVDQSNAFSACLSWFVFILLAVIVPCLSHFLLARDDSDAAHSRPYDNVVQLSLSSVAALSFVCLSQFVKKYGLRRFLFLDKLCDESETVRRGYTEQLNVSLLFFFPRLSFMH
uniref:Putative ovule protein n=1 Tax=Solanum chacoense TaxID=4108 RepID=A0A0V0H282_SOLCH